MLLRFGCENYKSIKEYQEILFTCSSTKDCEHHNLYKTDAIKEHVLPIVAIYGANASGKTNMIKALRLLCAGIENSARGRNDNVPPFRLDSECSNEPSIFDLDFILEGKHYHYGFAIKDSIIEEEWLYSFSNKTRSSRSVLFYRDKNLDIEDEEFYFGKNFKGQNKSISKITNETSLFLTVAAKSNHLLAEKIVEYIKNFVKFRFSSDMAEQTVGESVFDNSLEKPISKFISKIDIGAVKLSVEKVEREEEEKDKFNRFYDAINNAFGGDGGIQTSGIDDFEYVINIHRHDSNNNEVKFKFSDESLGTRALISILASIFKVLQSGGVFVVDELESSLHTLLSLKVVELFNCPKSNPHGAQLLFTTHETQLLNFNGVRKDEVWLSEKSFDGSTQLRPLTEYAIDKRANLRKGYLEGRFGAIPFLSTLDAFSLFEDDVEDGKNSQI
ncbi:AAA family ATPase [Shewanella atlantica]|uniref:ATP-binding protein n=1 Tax=Shewanella atlantica TaxID=271099 RepID=A0A431WDD0_9GAMM|nr:ATP-binding protein [Shewanella atlantica]RTR33520.1 ATP-binding protein [Shewanella atlantica]